MIFKEPESLGMSHAAEVSSRYITRAVVIVFASLLLSLAGWAFAAKPNDSMTFGAADTTHADMSQLAFDTYIWGYPLTYNMQQFKRFLNGGAPRYPDAAFNQFSHVRKRSDADEKFVSPNVDVVFSIAFCHLDNGPLLLSVPDTDGHYYVLQFLDPWTNNFAYVGRRATGTEAGEYLIVPSDYAGPVPEGMRVIRPPSNLFAIIGRVAVEDEHDLSTPHKIQDGFVLRAMEPDTASGTQVHSIPQPEPEVAADLMFWEQLRVLLAAYPPSAAESEWLNRLAPLGLLSASSPYIDPDPQLAETLRQAQNTAKQQLEEDIKNAFPTVNGWASIIHLFDHNLDYFEIGTRDEDQWKIDDRSAAHRMRAIAARAGLWGNHGYEASFLQVWVDADGKQLNGAHRYQWTLPKPPPAKAFWSLTMYQVPEFYLVANPLDRYAISSINKNVKYNHEGSLTLYLQTDNPGPEEQSNWLPTPPGDFRPALSIYEPDPVAFDPSYSLPPIRRIE